MALCDRLEAQLTSAQTDSRRLLEAILHQTLNPAAPGAAAMVSVQEEESPI